MSDVRLKKEAKQLIVWFECLEAVNHACKIVRDYGIKLACSCSVARGMRKIYGIEGPRNRLELRIHGSGRASGDNGFLSFKGRNS